MNDKIQNNLPLQNKQTSTCFEITSVTCTAVQQKLIPKSISKSWLFPVVLLLELLGGCCMFVKLWCMQKARGFIVPEHFWTFFSSKERLITKIQSQFPKFIGPCLSPKNFHSTSLKSFMFQALLVDANRCTCEWLCDFSWNCPFECWIFQNTGFSKLRMWKWINGKVHDQNFG